jgi:L-amino acid N-acyltransferase YncA
MPQLIREATPVDIPQILDLLREYRQATPLEFLKEADDTNYITQMLYEIMAGRGVLLIAEKEYSIFAMLIAGVHASRWSPRHLLLTELAYYVKPENRGGTAGYRLLREYIKRAERFKAEGRICHYFISKMINSPDLDYGRFGFKKLEEFWVV